MNKRKIAYVAVTIAMFSMILCMFSCESENYGYSENLINNEKSVAIIQKSETTKYNEEREESVTDSESETTSKEYVITTTTAGTQTNVTTDNNKTTASTRNTYTTISETVTQVEELERDVEVESKSDRYQTNERKDNSYKKTQNLKRETEENTKIQKSTVTKTQPIKTEIKEQSDEIVESTEAKLENYVRLKNVTIMLNYAPATQENVDKYSVVQDTKYWSNDKDIFLFGHNYRSFSKLSSIKIGDIITLNNYGIESSYKVFRSEKGRLSDDKMGILSLNDGVDLIKTDFEFETIRLITCDFINSRTERWIVIGEKMK